MSAPHGGGDAENSVVSGETTPLLSPGERKGFTRNTQIAADIAHFWSGDGQPRVGSQPSKAKTPTKERVMQYDNSQLATWSTFFRLSGTIWKNVLLWNVALKLSLLSFCVAVVVFLFSTNPGEHGQSAFGAIAEALKVFVALLLGFFITSSVGRWGNAVAGFLHIFNSIRNLNMQFYALGVPASRMRQIARYGILSVEFLVVELRLRIEQDAEVKEAEMSKARQELVERGRMTEQEARTIEKVADPSGVLWIWVASLIGSMAQDGTVPPMASPTYGRLMNLAQSAEEGIRQVNIATGVQMPFVYVHTLALLVHLNNVFSAISFGCSIGISVAAIFFRLGIYHGIIVAHSDQEGKGKSVSDSFGDNAMDAQTIMMTFVSQMVVPLLYQAFLQIGLLLSQPFDSPSLGVSAIPIDLLIQNLEKDLSDASVMAKELHGWEAPQFAVPK